MSSSSKKEDEIVFNTPQKKYIRNYVWAPYAAKRKEQNGQDHIKYLTFTAVECYDIQVLKNKGLLDVVEADGLLHYKSVAFCEKDIQKHALIKQKLPHARDYAGSFEQMIGANGNEIPMKVQQWFPFDVINLDFTSPMFSSEKSVVSKAIRRIFELQKLKQSSLSFFLTLPAKKDVDVETGKQLLDKNLKMNFANERMSEFKSEFISKYPDIDIDSNIYEQVDYTDYLLFSIPKMIISMGFNEHFDVKCSERYSYIGDHYDGNANSTQMVKFVFECEYVGESLGFNPLEMTCERYPKRVLDFFVRSPIDINELLDSDEGLRQKCCGLEF